MAVDKLVDSTQLDADLTSVANAIRTKGGTSAQMTFPAGFVSAVNAIPTGGGAIIEDTFDDWQRPSDWPNLDAICPNDFVGALITYQVRDPVYYPYNKIHLFINGNNPKTVELGTIQGGTFVPFETNTVSDTEFDRDLPSDHGEFIVVRVKCATFRNVYIGQIDDRYRIQPSVEAYICGGNFGLVSNVRQLSYNTQHCVFRDCIITSLYSAFAYAGSLKKVEFIDCDTSAATDIRNMFDSCLSMQKIEISLNLPNLQYIALPYVQSAKKIILHNITLPDDKTFSIFNQMSANPVVEVITLPTFKAADNAGNCFNNDYALMYLDLSRVDLTGVTSFSNIFNNCKSLITVLLPKICVSISFSASPLLSNDSLIGIANAVDSSATGQTVTLHADSKAKCLTIMGNNVDGVFVADATGSMSVTDFITNVKGWTVA